MTISVIIPCYNAKIWISDTLQSAAGQDISDIEIIVIDDGSVDGSADIVAKTLPSIKLIKTKNQGACMARNIGIKASKGEFIQFLDADDLLAEGKIKKQLKVLNESKADIAYGDWQKLVEDENGVFRKGEATQRKLKNPEIDLFTDFWSPPAAYLFRRSIVEKVGGFKESLPVIQDARFALDCALAGAEFVYFPGIMAYYRQHNSNSLSKRDWFAFHHDIYINAIDIEQIWKNHGGISKERKEALLYVYGYLARATFKKNSELFNLVLTKLKNLTCRYIPNEPKHLRLVSKVAGYRTAEQIAWWYRKIKFLFCGPKKI